MNGLLLNTVPYGLLRLRKIKARVRLWPYKKRTRFTSKMVDVIETILEQCSLACDQPHKDYCSCGYQDECKKLYDYFAGHCTVRPV